MGEMNISNTLVNDTSSGTVAYADQLKDRSIDWNEYTDEVPASMRKESCKFQSRLNKFFLSIYKEIKQLFLNIDSVPTQGSNNLVTSNGVFEAISNVQSDVIFSSIEVCEDIVEELIDESPSGEGGRMIVYPNSVGSPEIIDGSIEMQDLSNNVRERLDNVYEGGEETLHMYFEEN